MRRMIAVLVGTLLVAGSLAAQSQDRLLPQKRRITDEALARDRALIQTWQARADSLPRNRKDAYARARAIALLGFVASEYGRANRAPVLDSSFVQAVAIVQRIEAGRSWKEPVPEPVGMAALAPGLWQRLDALHAADTAGCAEAEIARAQVRLLFAIQEGRSGGPRSASLVVKEVEATAEDVRRRIATCGTPAPVDTASAAPPAPAPAPVSKPEPLQRRVVIPGEVHFAFDRAVLSPASRRVLDDAAAQLAAVPDALIRLDAYTDPVGSASYNSRLSARRGNAVRAYLITKGIAVARMTVVPLGAAAPVQEGATRRERYALDRRVDIQVLPLPDVKVERLQQREDLQPTPRHEGTRGS